MFEIIDFYCCVYMKIGKFVDCYKIGNLQKKFFGNLFKIEFLVMFDIISGQDCLKFWFCKGVNVVW